MIEADAGDRFVIAELLGCLMDGGGDVRTGARPQQLHLALRLTFFAPLSILIMIHLPAAC